MAKERNKILMVDDEPMNIELVNAYLSVNDYEGIFATDAQQGLKKLLEHEDEVMLILLDRMMPGLDGIGLLKKIKQEPKWSNIPIIMQTAAGAKEQVVEGIEAGAYYYLTKPFDEETLMSIIEAAVKDVRQREVEKYELQKNAAMMQTMKDAYFELRTVEEARALATFLAYLFPDPDRTQFGLFQLMSNAVVSGNLEIDYDFKTLLLAENRMDQEIADRLRMQKYASRIVRVNFKRTDTEITVTVKDEGPGFDWKPYLAVDPNRATDSHGRGIAIANMTAFDSLEYKDPGNEVTGTCKISQF
jgi:DNA-binding response OmpR family regulator